MTSSARRREPGPEVPGLVDTCANAVAQPTEPVADLAESTAEPGVDWTDLPDAVRVRLAEIAADAVSEITPVDIPQSARQVAKFAPAKRARLGAGTLLAGLRGHPAFRAAVTEWAREHRPAVLDLTAADPASAATAALLLADGAAVHYLELVRRRAMDAALRAERDAAVQRAGRLETELTRLRDDLSRAEGNAGQVVGEREAELEKLLKRLREQGVRLREARDEATAARADAEQMRIRTELERKSLTADRDRERERADAERVKARRAEADAQAARQAAREARQADEVRL